MPWPLLLTTLLFGGEALLAQTLLLRAFLSVVEENELFLGLFFAIWFAGIAAGAWLGGRLLQRIERGIRSFTLTALTLQAALLPVLLVSIQSLRANCGLPATGPLGPGTLFWVASAHLLPFSMLTGFAFPWLCRSAAAADGEAQERSLGHVFGWEAVGALAAGAAFTFYFAGRAGALSLSLAMAALVAFNSVLASALERPRPARAAAAGFTVAGLILLAAWSPPIREPLETWASGRWWAAYGQGLELVAQRQTRYQSLTLARQADQYSLLANGRFVASFPDPSADGALAGLALAERPSPRRILLVGGYCRGLTRLWLAAGAERIDVVELDPGLIGFVRPYLAPEDSQALADPRVCVNAVDGLWFIKQLARARPPVAERYDLVMVLAPDPTTLALNRTFTEEFFRDVRAILTPHGIFAFDMSSAVNYFGQEVSGYVGSVYTALTRVFPSPVGTPGVRVTFFASPDPAQPTSDPVALTARWEAMNLALPGFSPLYFQTAFESGALDFLNRHLARLRVESPPNTALRPISYLYGLRLWSRVVAPSARPLLDWAASLPRWMALAFFLALAAIWTGLGMRGGRDEAARRRAVALCAIGSTGAAGFALSLVGLLAFQATLGNLYQQVGLLAALYMAGLAAGSLILARRPRRPWAVVMGCDVALLVWIVMTAALYCALAAGRLDLTSGQTFAAFYAALFGAGLASGAQFAAAGHLYNSPQAAAALDSVDHAGAILGALLTTLVLVPAMGLAGALVAYAAMKLIGLNAYLRGMRV